MMLPIWSTNNAINSGHRPTSSGRRANPPSCDVTARRDRREPAGGLTLELSGISPKLPAHDPQSEDIWEREKSKYEGLSAVISALVGKTADSCDLSIPIPVKAVLQYCF